MGVITENNLLEALRPDPTQTKFPVPRLVTGSGPGGLFTYESFNLAGTLLPGQWLLTDATRVFGWQIMKGNGLTGATLSPTGDEPMTLKFAIKVWTSVDAGEYMKLLKTILRKPVGILPGSKADTAALGIDHPGALALGVTAVVVKSVTGLMNPLVTSGGKGAWTAAVEFLEWRQPVEAPKPPKQTTPEVPPNPPTSGRDAQTIENDKLAVLNNAKANELARRLRGGAPL